MARVGPLAGKDIDALWAALRPRILGLAFGGGGFVGPAGPMGPKGVVWKGAWATGTDYEEGDIVTNDSAGGETLTFFCIDAHTSWPAAEPPVGGDTRWHEINPGYLIISGERAMTGDLNMADHEVDAAKNINMAGLTVGEAQVNDVRQIHLIGDDDDGEARVDGAERIVFNDEPTKSVIEKPSVVQFNSEVTPGVDTTHQEGQVGWSALEEMLVADAMPAAFDGGTETPRFPMGWVVVNGRNASGGMIEAFRVVYDDAIDGSRPQVTPWDGNADTFAAQLGTSQKITGVTLNGSDDGEPVQVLKRGIIRTDDDNSEGWVTGDLLWADRTTPGGVTKNIETSGEYARIFIGTVIDDGGGEGFVVDVDVRVLPTLGEMSFVEIVSLLDNFVPIWNSAAGWVPGLLPAVGVTYVPSGDLTAENVQDAIDELASIRWDDLRFPAQGINPPGGAADPGVDNDTGLLVFSGNQDNVIAGVAQMPHSWDVGSIIRPHLHLRFPTSAAANTRWRFAYDIANPFDDFSNASGTYTTLATITVANPQNVNTHVAATFGDLDMTGFHESAIILWKISRLANSDAADTDTNDCLLLEFDIHFQLIKRGSWEEFPGVT